MPDLMYVYTGKEHTLWMGKRGFWNGKEREREGLKC